jgi:protein TonB
MAALQEFRPSHGQAIETNRWPGVLFAGALHILAIYALATGVPRPVTLASEKSSRATVVVELPKNDLPPPPLPPDIKPPPVVAIVPEVEISLSRPPLSAATLTSPPSSAAIVHAPAAILQTPPIPITSHAVTSDDYPDLSVRLHEEGVVKIKYLVQVDGTVGECAVIRSSGSSRLDAAACAMVKRRWRFMPATEKGKPVAAYLLADVSFTILPASEN